MISLEDIIKYVGLAIIIFCLVKAFADKKIKDQYILLLVLFIMAPIVFLQVGKFTCPRVALTENYQVTDPPVVPSIYPGPPNRDRVLGTVTIPPPLPASATDLDVQDQKSISGIDMQIFEKLGGAEDRAKDKIRRAYANEMVFTRTNPLNTVPLGTQLYGYTYLPPENWFRAYERPPVCLVNGTDKLWTANPIDEGAYVRDLLEFDTETNIPGPTLATSPRVRLTTTTTTVDPVGPPAGMAQVGQPITYQAQVGQPITNQSQVGQPVQQSQPLLPAPNGPNGYVGSNGYPAGQPSYPNAQPTPPAPPISVTITGK